MSFSFRNLFSQDSQEESTQAPSNAGPGADANPGGPPPGMAPSPEAAPPEQSSFSPTPQPTDRGNFEAMFSNQGAAAGGAGQGDRSAFGAPPTAAPGNRQRYSVHEIIPFIPPALVAQSGVPMDRSVEIELPADGSTDIRLSAIYAVCPELFAADITPLNDSVVTLPLPADAASGPSANPFSSALPGNAAEPFAIPQQAGGLPNPRQEMPAAGNPFLNNPPAGDADEGQTADSASFSPPPSFSLPTLPPQEALPESDMAQPFGGALPPANPLTPDFEAVQAEVLPAEFPESEALSPIQDPAPASPESASPFGFPPPKNGPDNEGAASPFGPFGSPPAPAAESDGKNAGFSGGSGFGFPPNEPAAGPESGDIVQESGETDNLRYQSPPPAREIPSEPAPPSSFQIPGSGSEPAPQPPAANPFDSQGIPAPAQEPPAANPFDSQGVPEPAQEPAAANPFDSQGVPESAQEPAAANPFDSQGVPEPAQEPAAANPFDSQGVPEPAQEPAAANPFDSQGVPESAQEPASANPFDSQGVPESAQEPASANPFDSQGVPESAQEPASANPFDSQGIPDPAQEPAAANPFDSQSVPEPAQEPFENPLATPPSADTASPIEQPNPLFGGGGSPFAQPPTADGPAGGRSPAPAPAPGGSPAETEPARRVSFHLRNLLGGAPGTGIDPLRVPVEAIIHLPVSFIEPQLASGSVTVSLAELTSFAEPSIAPILQAGNAEALVPLPDNDLFHQITDLAPMPPPGAPEADAEPEPEPEPAGNLFPDGPENTFATPFSQRLREEGFPPVTPTGGFPAAGETSEADISGPLSPTIPEAPANPFGQTPPSEEKERAEEPTGMPQFRSDPFAPLERSGAREAPGEAPGGNLFDSPDADGTMPSEDSPSPFRMPGQFAAPEPPGESTETQLPSFDALIPQRDAEPGMEEGATGGSSFFDELEENAQVEQAPAELPPVDDEIVSDVELRAVFGSSESFDSQKVADLSAELPGVAACVITGSRGVFQGRKGADPAFAENAETLIRSARDFARATGVPNAESFTMHTDQGVISIFVSGEDCCLAVRHEPGGFDPGVREKLILVSRGLSGLN